MLHSPTSGLIPSDSALIAHSFPGKLADPRDTAVRTGRRLEHVFNDCRELIEKYPDRPFENHKTLVEAIRTALANGADPNEVSALGDTALNAATSLRSVPVAKLLLDAGARHDLPNESDGRAPLHTAAFWCSLDMVATLLHAGADPRATDKSASTPLHLPFDNDAIAMKIMRRLLDAGADINALDRKRRNALHRHLRLGIRGYDRLGAIAEFLIDKGTDIHAVLMNGQTALHQAANCGAVEVVELLIRRGADIHARCELGKTPLYEAMLNRQMESAVVLAQAGSDVNSTGRFGVTLLMASIEQVHPAMTQWLLASGANPDLQSRRGLTALHCCAEKGNWQRALLLLAGGADETIVNAAGMTFQDMAVINKDQNFLDGVKPFFDAQRALQAVDDVLTAMKHKTPGDAL